LTRVAALTALVALGSPAALTGRIGSVTAMRSRTLGATGLAVSPIGLGLAALGRPAYINLGRQEDLGSERSVEAMERRCHQVLDAAYRAGVRYLDAARSYGLAEAFLASWLRGRDLARAAVTVGSKWGYTYTGGWRLEAEVQEVKDHSLATLRRQLAETRELLGDWLDLYEIHSATLESGVLEDRRVLAELVRLREEGLVVGLTTSGPRQAAVVQRALEVEVDGLNPFGVVQATWNLLEPSVGSMLAAAHDRGWGVIVKEALANGRLTAHGRGPERATLDRVARRHAATADGGGARSGPRQPVGGRGALRRGHAGAAAQQPRCVRAGTDLGRTRGAAQPRRAGRAVLGRARLISLDLTHSHSRSPLARSPGGTSDSANRCGQLRGACTLWSLHVAACGVSEAGERAEGHARAEAGCPQAGI
jgi:aryl-alcohol dehydrogenase-like predicted oxidoreductase